VPDDPRQAAPPSPSETVPPPGGGDSSPASAKASKSEPAGFIVDPGPAFDPEAAASQAPPPPLAPEPPALEVEWDEEVIRSLLGIQGRALHAGIGVSEQDWIHTDVDLQAIAPPLTRICNRYEPVRRYARHADPVTLVTGLAAYATRSLLERRQALEQLPVDEGGTQPIPPAEAPPVPPSEAPRPQTPPRQAASMPATPPGPPPMQPSEGPAPPPPPRPAEAPIDPTQVDWQVNGG
jgi:hypothetical protein